MIHVPICPVDRGRQVTPLHRFLLGSQPVKYTTTGHHCSANGSRTCRIVAVDESILALDVVGQFSNQPTRALRGRINSDHLVRFWRRHCVNRRMYREAPSFLNRCWLWQSRRVAGSAGSVDNDMLGIACRLFAGCGGRLDNGPLDIAFRRDFQTLHGTVQQCDISGF